jgi:hypothetical protein
VLIHDSTALATGTAASGLTISGGGTVVQDSVIRGINGSTGKAITTFGGSGDDVFIDRSSLIGDPGPQGHAIFSADDIEFFVGTSLLKGDVLTFNANNNITCIYDYDENYVGLNATCQ